MSEQQSSCALADQKSGTVEYLQIPNFSGYLASSDGHIWRDTPDGLIRVPTRIVTGGGDYLQCSLYDDQGFFRTVKRAVLVLLAFKGNRPRGYEACHDDGDDTNDVPGNLYWGTKKQNQKDRSRHGTIRRGEGHGRAKLSDAQVIEIRRRRKSGESPKSLAAEYGVSSSTICNICSGKIRTKTDGGDPLEA